MKVIASQFLSILILVFILAPNTFSQDNNQTGIQETGSYFDKDHSGFFAQLDDAPPQGMPNPPDDEEFDKPKRKYIEQLRILKLLELLDLNEDQDVEFIRLYRNHRKGVKEVEKEHVDKVKELSDGLKKDKISEEQILRLTSEILGKSEERSSLDKSFLIDSKKILSANQYGKLVIFQERFERELLEQVRQFRNKDRFGPGQNRRGFGFGKQNTSDFGK